jgi:hypothetical protein
MPLGTLKDFHTGEKVAIAGLVLLVASFGLFLAQSLFFDFRMRLAPTVRSASLSWKPDLYALYAASVLIFVRSVFRLVEYSQGNAGYLISHEWTLYVFDTTLMFTVLVLFNVLHPSHVTALLKGGWYSEKMGMRIVKAEKPGGMQVELEERRGQPKVSGGNV